MGYNAVTTAFVVTESAGHTLRFITDVDAKAGETDVICEE